MVKSKKQAVITINIDGDGVIKCEFDGIITKRDYLRLKRIMKLEYNKALVEYRKKVMIESRKKAVVKQEKKNDE